MYKAKWLLATFAVLAMAGSAFAQPIVLIDPDTNNGSFEYANGVLNTEKITEWAGVDNWTEWEGESTDATDSGVEMTGSATDGVMSSFLRGGNAAYNLTTYTAQAGDLFTFSWDHALREDRDHSVWLLYDDGGTITKIDETQLDSDASSTAPYTISGFFTIPAGHASIGKEIGLGIHTTGAYPEVDNFLLDVETGGMPPVTGDVNGDFIVDLVDYGIIQQNFRLSPASKEQGDITGADIVDLEDFLLWRANHPTPAGISASESAIPEPASWLLSLMALGMLARRNAR